MCVASYFFMISYPVFKEHLILFYLYKIITSFNFSYISKANILKGEQYTNFKPYF